MKLMLHGVEACRPQCADLWDVACRVEETLRSSSFRESATFRWRVCASMLESVNKCPLPAGRFSHCCGPKHVDQSPYVRVSFASATHAELREGMKRVGITLRAANSAAQSPPSGAAAASANSHHANQASASSQRLL